MNRFLAQHLQFAQKLSARAQTNSFLLNENAYQGLTSKDQVKVFDASALLYTYAIPTTKKTGAEAARKKDTE